MANALGSKSKVVSRAHAEIWMEYGGRFLIHNTKSSSDTLLNHIHLCVTMLVQTRLRIMTSVEYLCIILFPVNLCYVRVCSCPPVCKNQGCAYVRACLIWRLSVLAFPRSDGSFPVTIALVLPIVRPIVPVPAVLILPHLHSPRQCRLSQSRFLPPFLFYLCSSTPGLLS